MVTSTFVRLPTTIPSGQRQQHCHQKRGTDGEEDGGRKTGTDEKTGTDGEGDGGGKTGTDEKTDTDGKQDEEKTSSLSTVCK